jgi:hypothetical protein
MGLAIYRSCSGLAMPTPSKVGMFSESEEENRDTNCVQVNKKEPAILIRNVSLLILVLLLPLATAQAQSDRSCERAPSKSLDPMNRTMEELGVTGHDTTQCSDRWYSCTTYDRQQFDQKYPGRPLNELLRYGEPSWPSGECERRDSRETRDWSDSLDQ